jgi:hypothetical protein
METNMTGRELIDCIRDMSGVERLELLFLLLSTRFDSGQLYEHDWAEDIDQFWSSQHCIGGRLQPDRRSSQ